MSQISIAWHNTIIWLYCYIEVITLYKQKEFVNSTSVIVKRDVGGLQIKLPVKSPKQE